MIKREDYLSALELIDQYHRQFNLPDKEEISIRLIEHSKKTCVSKWIDNLHEKPSVRLHNILLHYDFPFEYVEDVEEIQFKRIRNAGKVMWYQFKKLRDA